MYLRISTTETPIDLLYILYNTVRTMSIHTYILHPVTFGDVRRGRTHSYSASANGYARGWGGFLVMMGDGKELFSFNGRAGIREYSKAIM